MRWDEIYKSPPTSPLPSVPPLSVPRVGTPTCPEHCSGRHEVEDTLRCPRCDVDTHRLIAHEWFHADGQFFYTLARIGSDPAPTPTSKPTCDHCGCGLTRRAV